MSIAFGAFSRWLGLGLSIPELTVRGTGGGEGPSPGTPGSPIGLLLALTYA